MWPTVTLSEITEINPRFKDGDIDDESIVFLPMTNISTDGGVDTSKVIPFFDFDHKSYSHVRQDDIIVAQITPCFENGKISIVDLGSHSNGFATGSAFILRPNKEMIQPRYLLHALRNGRFQFIGEKQMRGTTGRKMIPRSFVESYSIILPPIEEQERIVDILDKANEIEQETTSAHRMREQLIRSTFLDLFGDPHINPNKFEEMTLRDVSTHYTDGPFGSNLKSSHYTVEGPRVIRLGDIDVGEINDDNISRISAEHYQSLQRHHLREGDVVVATLGNPMLRSAIVARSALPAINKSDVLLIRPNTDLVLAEYISCLFNSTLEGGYWSNLIHGQTRGRISGGQLSKVVI